jgi:hypothetical protein
MVVLLPDTAAARGPELLLPGGDACVSGGAFCGSETATGRMVTVAAPLSLHLGAVPEGSAAPPPPEPYRNGIVNRLQRGQMIVCNKVGPVILFY